LKLLADDDSVEIIRITSRKEGGPVLFGFNPESKLTVQVQDRKELKEFFDSQTFPSPLKQEEEEIHVPYYKAQVVDNQVLPVNSPGIIYAGEDSQSQPCPLESIEIEEQHRSLGSALKPIRDEFKINLQIDEEESEYPMIGGEDAV